jgi:hypothetical protein
VFLLSPSDNMMKLPSLLTLYSRTEFYHMRCEFSGFISVPAIRIYHIQCTNTVKKFSSFEGDFFLDLQLKEKKARK